MDIFNIAADVTVTEEKDVLGGFQPFEQDIYPFVIKAAYLDKSSGGAHCIVLLMETPDERKYTHTEYITNKSGQNFYIDKKTGKKMILPGMAAMNNLSMHACGKDISAAEKAEKVVKIFDRKEKKEVPQKRVHITEWQGKVVHAAMLKVIETKMAKDENGAYTIPTAETRVVNQIDRWFDSNLLTTAEKKLEEPKAEFYQKWLDKNKGGERDKTVKGAPQAGTPSAPAAPAPLVFS